MTKKKLIILSFNLIIILLLTFCMNFEYNSMNMSLMIYINIGLMVYVFGCSKFLNMKIVSIYGLFMICNFIFLFGRVWVVELFSYNSITLGDLGHVVSNENIFKAVKFSNLGSIFLFLGTVIFYKTNKKEIDKNKNIDEKQAMRYLGVLLITIAILPAMSEYIKDFSLALNGGYRAVLNDYSYGITSIFGKIARYFDIGLFILFLSYTDKKRRAKKIAIVMMFFWGSQMFFGARGLVLIKCLILIILWNNYIEKISMKKIIIAIIIIPIVVTLLNVIKEMRQYPLEEWIKNLGGILFESFKNNPIKQLLYELGVAIYPTGAAIENVPQVIEYNFGKSYLYSVLLLIPNLGGGPNVFLKDANVAAQVAKIEGASFGGSMYQEAYFNWGVYSVIFFVAIGGGVIYISNQMQEKITVKVPLIAWISVEFLWSIRNGLYVLPRVIVFEAIFPFLIYYLILNYIKRRKRWNQKLV